MSDPSDNGPRLIYGDWLQSKGDPRGELMVVQCRLAEGGAAPAEEKKLRATEKKLLKALEKPLAYALAEALGYPKADVDALTVRVEVERGFVTTLQAPVDVLKKLDAAFAAAPLLTGVRMSGLFAGDILAPIDASYFESPLLARLESLAMGTIGNAADVVGLLARCPHLANLRSLTLSNTRFFVETNRDLVLTAEGVNVLVGSPYLTGLTNLTLDDNRLGAEGIGLIARAPWKLTSLSVANNDATGLALEALAHATHHEGLRRLRICGIHSASASQVSELFSARHLSSLVALDIEHCDFGAPGLAAMLDAMNLPALEELIAASNGFGEKGAELIAKSSKLSKLAVLDITKNGFNKKGVIALANGPGLAGIGKVLLNERDSEDARNALAKSLVLRNTNVYFRGKLIAKPKL